MPYFRAPTIGANSEYEKLASLGLKFQWTDATSGEWKEAAAQRVNLFREERPVFIRTGMRILGTLTGTIYQDGTGQVPGWMLARSRNVVKRLVYDHLRQTNTLENVPQHVVAWPRDHTVDHNRGRLRRYVQDKGSDTVLDDRAQMAGNSKGRSCDLCLSLTMVGLVPTPLLQTSTDVFPSCNQTASCGYDSGTQSCFRCRSFNRPCTFTYRGTGEFDNDKDAHGRVKRPNTVDMLASGASLEELGMRTHLQAVLGEYQTAQMIHTIDPPFAPEIDLDVATEQKDTPVPQSRVLDDDDDDE